MINKICVQTDQKTEVINVTEKISGMVRKEFDGLALFFVPHTTATLLMCEDDDELRDDIVRTVDKWLSNCQPFSHFRNNSPNAEAHILSAFGGNGITVAIENGKINLGKYQNILLLEMDGPKKREIRCKFIGS